MHAEPGKEDQLVIATTISATTSGMAISAVAAPRPKQPAVPPAGRAGAAIAVEAHGGDDGDDDAVDGGVADRVIVGDRDEPFDAEAGPDGDQPARVEGMITRISSGA